MAGTAKTIDKIEFISNDGKTDLERYNTQLKTLILSTECVIPGSRGFGLPREFLSRTGPEAINIFAIELEEKVDEYIPEISIAKVEGTATLDGIGNLRIYVEGR